ncbi:hypothetical protein DWB98_04560 [Staphylococcus xylosus]|nr:hypothetical protein BU118_08930 [Staphylococcus xylosus]PTI73518.1 hypothetical protein BU102_09165 [Staphylococcus xylosus]QDW88735.1 hypothetical protein DWB98_04560 [Staphylococcus xylosus]
MKLYGLISIAIYLPFLLKNDRYSAIFSTFRPIMILIISYIYKGKSNEFIFTHCFNVISYY